MPEKVAWLINGLFTVYYILLTVRVLLTWVPARPNGLIADVFSVLYMLTEPLLAPIRKIIPPIPMGTAFLDLAPLILILLLNLVQGFLF